MKKGLDEISVLFSRVDNTTEFKWTETYEYLSSNIERNVQIYSGMGKQFIFLTKNKQFFDEH